MRPNFRANRWQCIVALLMILSGLAGFGLTASPAQSVTVLDSILSAQGFKESGHRSIQWTGTVDRAGKVEPFRLIASSDENLRIEYGGSGKDTMILSTKLAFHDDGSKFVFEKVGPGFSQLDITGSFFIEQLRSRQVRIESIPNQKVNGVDVQGFRVGTDRSEIHRGVRVDDRSDLYLDKNGILVGVVRHYYDGHPEAYSLSFNFSDFRKTGDVLLPYQIDVSIKTHISQTFHVEQIQFDVPITPVLFQSRRTK